MRRYSLDTKKDFTVGDPSPGMDGLYEEYIKPNIGKIRCALICQNVPQGKGGRILRMYNAQGELESHKFLNK